MITLGTATLVDADEAAHDVYIAVTWEPDGSWSGIVGGTLDWSALAPPVRLEVPAWLGPTDEPVSAGVVIDATLERNEIMAHGALMDAAPRHEHRRAFVTI